MSWPKNHLPKYRKHRASGQAIVTLNGRDFYLGPHNTTASKREYDRLIAEWLSNARQPLGVNDAEITVVELCARYLLHAKEYYQKNGRCTGVVPGIKCALRYVLEWYGRAPAREFGPLALKALRERMIEQGHTRRYINDHVDRIKRVFGWGVSEELVPARVYEALKTVKGLRKGRTEARETEPVRPVDNALVEATLEALTSVVADMVRLQ